MNQTNLAAAKTFMWGVLASQKCKDFVLSHEGKNKFTYTTDPVEYIYSNIAASGHLETRIFYPRWWQWIRKKVAMYVYATRYPYTIFINYTILRWDKERLAAKLGHDLCHLRGYGHGANYLAGNKGQKYRDSVPCRIEKFILDFDERDI